MNRISVLDSLRGLAASIVVFHHSFCASDFFYSLQLTHIKLFNFLNFISNLNQQAVFFFFILSGFCIQLSSSKLNFNLKSDINNYFFKRFKRILPLYWFAILLTIVVGGLMLKLSDPVFSIKTLVGNLLFLQTSNLFSYSWFVPYGGNGPLWSLAYEMFYYLIFPFFWILVLKIHSKTKISISAYDLALISSIIFSTIAFLLNKVLPNPFFTYSIYFMMWYSGVYLAHLYQNNLKKYSLISILVVFTILIEVLMLQYPSDTLNSICKSNYLFMIAYILYAFPLLRKNVVFQMIKNTINLLFTTIGEGSYALYLIHYPILKYLLYLGLFSHWYEPFIFFIVVSIISIGIEKIIIKFPFTFLKINYVGK